VTATRPCGRAWPLVAALATGLLTGVASAQVPEALEGLPLVRVEVEGADADALPDLGLAPGVPLRRGLVRHAVQTLLTSGRWSDVQVDARPEEGGVSLALLVTPRLVLARIEMRGHHALSEDELRQALRVREGQQVEASALVELAASAEAVFAERGLVHARVELRLRDTDDAARKVLLVEVHEGAPERLHAIRWTNDTPPDAESLVSALGVDLGGVLERRRLEAGVRALEQRLREQGWLEAVLGEPTVSSVDEGAVLTLPLRLGRRWHVLLRGFEPLRRPDVEAVLNLTGEPLTDGVAGDLGARVAELYRRHGFHRVTVNLRRTLDPERPGDPRAAQMIVDIAPGRRLDVLGVSFPGATHFDRAFLRDQVNSYLEEDLPTPELFWPVDSDVADRIGLGGRSTRSRREVTADVEVLPSHTWYEPTYVQAAAHIEELLEADGYLDAHVTPPELRELDPDHAIVVIAVDEGPRTRVYDVTVHGQEILGARAILEESRLARGDAFGYLPLEEAERRIRDLYAERGHLFARVESRVQLSPDRERAQVVFDIVEGAAVHVAGVDFVGAEVTDAGLLRDVAGFFEGNLYRPSRAREIERRLLALGIFQTVNVSPANPEVPEPSKRVVVTLQERQPQFVGLSAGFGTGEGARGTFEYGYRNLLGLGITLSIRVQLAYQFFFQDPELADAITRLSLLDRLERRLTAGIQIPWIPGLPNVRVSLDLASLRDNERDFGYDKNGLALTPTWQPERRVTLSVSGELEQNNVQLFGAQSLRELVAMAVASGDTRTQRLLRVPEGATTIASARISGSWDLRDSPFTPTRGLFLTGSAEFVRTLDASQPGATGPSFLSNFLKLQASVAGYVPIATGWVLALQARGGRVLHLEDASSTYPNRAFYLGGVDTLRGFLQEQLVPEDQATLIRERGLTVADIVRTGDVFYVVRAELRMPLIGDLRGAAFCDVGNVWAGAESFDLFLPRWTAGLGLRLSTPVGPVALDYGFNLDRRVDLGEPFGSLHFSIGVF